MNHTQVAFDKLYSIDGGTLNSENQNILSGILKYTLQSQKHFDSVATEFYETFDLIENELVEHNLRQIVTLNNQHIRIGQEILNILETPNILQSKYDDGSLEEELNLFYKNVDCIMVLFDNIQTIRFRLWQLQICDGGAGVTVYGYLVRYYNIIWAIITKAELIERVHNAGGHSSLNVAEPTVGGIKDQTRINHPITPTTSISFNDINNKDLVNVDLTQYEAEQIKYYKYQSRELCKLFAEILNGNKTNNTFIKSRVFNYEEEEKGNVIPYLINKNLHFIIKQALKPKNAFHCFIEFIKQIEENHALLQPRLRQSIDMSSNHYIKIPHDCPLQHKTDEENGFIGIGIAKPPIPGQWKTISNKKYTNHEVFDYIPVSLEPLKGEEMQHINVNIPSRILQKYIDDDFFDLFEILRPVFKDVPYDCPIKSKSVSLPQKINDDITNLLKPKGLKPDIIKQDLNKTISSIGSIKKYHKNELKDAYGALKRNLNIIWQYKRDIINKNVNVPIQSIVDEIKTIVPALKTETILIFMNDHINRITKSKELTKRFNKNINIRSNNNSSNHNLRNNNNRNNNDSSQSDSSQSDSDESSHSDSDVSSQSSSQSSSSTESESDDEQIVCVICDDAKPPLHLVNHAVSDIWLTCSKNNCYLHFECSDVQLPPRNRKVKHCGIC